MAPFQPPLNRPRPMPSQPQPLINTGWRDVYSPLRQEPQRPNLPGFYISSPQDITPRDIPMDGSISFFPSNDLSYIMIKQWTGNGTIAEARYILEPQTPISNSIPEQEKKNNDNSQENCDFLQNSSNDNSKLVEVISAALDEQTQRLTAAFSQIGLAFNTLQQKMDSFAVNFSKSDELILAESDLNDRQKSGSKLKNKEPKDSEKS